MSKKKDKPSIDRMAKVFIKIRDRRAKLSEEFKIMDADLKEKQAQIGQEMLGWCKDNNLEGARTEFGTVSRSTKSTYWASDWESMHDFIRENRCPEFLNKAINQTNVKAFLEENPDVMPPGLNLTTEYVISVRKPTKRA